jgi:hypothetical protein
MYTNIELNLQWTKEQPRIREKKRPSRKYLFASMLPSIAPPVFVTTTIAKGVFSYSHKFVASSFDSI